MCKEEYVYLKGALRQRRRNKKKKQTVAFSPTQLSNSLYSKEEKKPIHQTLFQLSSPPVSEKEKHYTVFFCLLHHRVIRRFSATAL